MRSKFLNGGAFHRTAFLLGATTAKTQTATAWLDRKLGSRDLIHSAKIVITYTAVLAASETLSAALTVQTSTSSAGTSPSTVGSAVAATQIASGGTSGATVTDTVEFDVDLEAAYRYINGLVTLSTSGSGTVSYTATLVGYGDTRQPATKAIANIGLPT